MMWINNHRILIARRIVQLTIIMLYLGAHLWGWRILEGNLGSSLLFGTVPLADPLAVLQIAAAGIFISTDLLIGAAVITLFYMLIGGRTFCSWVCPVNLVTDAAGWLRRRLRIDEVAPKTVMSRRLRYWALGLTLLLSALFGMAAFELISPIGILNRGLIFGLGMGGGVVGAIFLFDLFGIKNGFCGHLCPLGAWYALIGRFSLIRVKHDHEKCTLCMRCTAVCPEKPVLHMIGKRSEFVGMGECTNCGRCVEACNDNALGFDLRSLRQQTARSNQ